MNTSSVFYAETYHPIQAGSIDGTDVLPHDNAVYRALLTSSAGLYDPFGDPKVTGDPYCSLFVGRLSQFTTEDTLTKAMEKYGRVKNLRLVRHIVTGASRGYAFVEFETERDMLRAFEEAHHSVIDDSEIIVDYNRHQLMPGWIPRRLGGGLGGKKESGQLRFGGRERPFRAPLRPIPYEELKRLGIPPPPEGKYKSRFQVPSPPRRDSNVSKRRDAHPERIDTEHSSKRYSMDREKSSRRSVDREHHYHRKSRRVDDDHYQEEDDHKERYSADREKSSRRSVGREHHSHWKSKRGDDDHYQEEDDHKERYSLDREKSSRRSVDREYHSHRKSRRGEEDHSREENDPKDGSHQSKKRRLERSVRNSVDIEVQSFQGSKRDQEEYSYIVRNTDSNEDTKRSVSKDRDDHISRSSKDGDEHSSMRYKDDKTRSRKRSKDDETRNSKRSKDHEDSSYKRSRHSSSHSLSKRHLDDSKSPSNS